MADMYRGDAAKSTASNGAAETGNAAGTNACVSGGRAACTISELAACFSGAAETGRLICQIGRRLYELGYASANDGNISARSGDRVLTTPTAVSKGFMTEDMLVCVDMAGNKLAGDRNPSSELKMHLKVYSALPGVGAVIHAHSPLATAFAVCRRPLDRNLMPEGIVALGTVPVAEYATPSTEAVPQSVVPFLNGEYTALLLANHGVLVWDATLEGALFKLQTVEYMAGIYINTDKLGGGVELPDDEVRRLKGLRSFYAAHAKGQS